MKFLFLILCFFSALAQDWRQPPEEILRVLHAPDLPWAWTAPGGGTMLLADGVLYPPLATRAAPMHELAGVRLNPATNSFYGEQGATSPRLLRVSDGRQIQIPLPANARLLGVSWTADGGRFALKVLLPDHIGIWTGSVDGDVREIKKLQLNPMLGSELAWMPDQEHLLVKQIPKRGPAPLTPLVPSGPRIFEGAGDKPRSTYEARNLLKTAHDEALFVHYATSAIAIVDSRRGRLQEIGAPDLYSSVSASPDGRWLLVERLRPPWSHETGWWRFAHEVEVWSLDGTRKLPLASLPLAREVPIQGVPLGMRGASWRDTAPATVLWVEALDGGNPANKADHRDRLMKREAPFQGEATELFKAQHRITDWTWGEKGGTLMLSQYERERRWRHEWLLDVDAGTARPWFDLSANESYADPGNPLLRRLPDGGAVLRQEGDAVWFAGAGSTPQGDRPFLDLRSMSTDRVERVFRCDETHFESFVAFVDDPKRKDRAPFLIRRESLTEVPNYHLVTLGASVQAPEGEALFARSDRPVTAFQDPAPELRRIEKRIVTYKRADGVPLSFHLYLPPDYKEGTRLPTVLYAYPMEYSDASTAGQVTGSARRFVRFRGASHLFFLLRGYAVLDQTAMPVIGDPETAYDTFVEQLVADARAAIDKAVEIGVTDPDRVGVTGHSHGALMTATLLAHSDLMRAGIARSGSYNHTIRPFGFQSERRTLWEAKETYTHLSPVMYAPQIREPLLLIHGETDENPGTVPYQSDRLFDALRGSGATVRLVMLPFEGHGYQARESIEHVLWEQITWFDKHVRDASTPPAGESGGR